MLNWLTKITPLFVPNNLFYFQPEMQRTWCLLQVMGCLFVQCSLLCFMADNIVSYFSAMASVMQAIYRDTIRDGAL